MYCYVHDCTSTLRIWKVCLHSNMYAYCVHWYDNTCVFTRFHSVKNANTQLLWSSERGTIVLILLNHNNTDHPWLISESKTHKEYRGWWKSRNQAWGRHFMGSQLSPFCQLDFHTPTYINSTICFKIRKTIHLECQKNLKLIHGTVDY